MSREVQSMARGGGNGVHWRKWKMDWKPGIFIPFTVRRLLLHPIAAAVLRAHHFSRPKARFGIFFKGSMAYSPFGYRRQTVGCTVLLSQGGLLPGSSCPRLLERCFIGRAAVGSPRLASIINRTVESCRHEGIYGFGHFVRHSDKPMSSLPRKSSGQDLGCFLVSSALCLVGF